MVVPRRSGDGWYIVRDDDGVQEVMEYDSCGGYDGRCGGCAECLAMQAEHAGWAVERTKDPKHAAVALVLCKVKEPEAYG